MSEQNNTSFAHAFLPGLILGLIVGAVAGAFVPDMMGGNKIKIDQSNTSPSTTPRDQRDARPSAEDENVIDEAVDEAGNAIQDAAEDAVEDAENTAEELIDDATNALPDSP